MMQSPRTLYVKLSISVSRKHAYTFPHRPTPWLIGPRHPITKPNDSYVICRSVALQDVSLSDYYHEIHMGHGE